MENLEFLADVIPPTVPYKQVRERKNKAAKDAEAGQLMLNGQRILPIGASNGKKKGTPDGDTVTVNGAGAGAGDGAAESEKGNDTEMV